MIYVFINIVTLEREDFLKLNKFENILEARAMFRYISYYISLSVLLTCSGNVLNFVVLRDWLYDPTYPGLDEALKWSWGIL